jgi:hypothetical protein
MAIPVGGLATGLMQAGPNLRKSIRNFPDIFPQRAALVSIQALASDA